MDMPSSSGNGGRKTGLVVTFSHSPYNRMMARDVALIILAIITVVGLIVLLAAGRNIPGEMWGMVSAVIGSIIGSMGRYNGQDSTRHDTP